MKKLSIFAIILVITAGCGNSKTTDEHQDAGITDRQVATDPGNANDAVTTDTPDTNMPDQGIQTDNTPVTDSLNELPQDTFTPPPAIQWSKTYDFGGADFGFSVLSLADGYLVAGSTDGGDGLDPGMLLVKLDFKGNIVWKKSLGATKSDSLKKIVSDGKDGFFAVGYFYPENRSDSDMIVLKLDKDGNEIWRVLVNKGEDDEGWGVLPLDDGGCLAVGLSVDTQTMHNDALAAKIDAQGKVVWAKTFGGDANDELRAAATLDNGGFAVVGSTVSFGSGMHDLYFVRLKPNGDVESGMTIGGQPDDYAYDMIKLESGNMVIVGASNSFTTAIDRDVWLLSVDPQGNKIWEQHYGKAAYEYGYQVIRMPDGFVVAGSMYDVGSGVMDGLVIRTDDQGKLKWMKTYDRGGKEGLYGIAATADRGMVAVGYAKPDDNGSPEDLLVEKMDGNGDCPDTREK